MKPTELSSARSVQPTSRFGTRAVLAGVALALVAVPFGLMVLLVEDKWSPLSEADANARDGLHGYAVTHAGFVGAMQLISDSGSALAWLLVLGAVVLWLLWRRLPRLALFVVVTAAGSSVLNAVVKSAVHRLRPALANPVAHAGGFSFPSGHAQAAVVGYAVLLLVFLPFLHAFVRKTAVTFAILLVVAIGLSRVALGVHYVSDVIAGIVLGAAWVAAMAAAFNTTRVERGRRRVEVAENLEPELAPRLGSSAIKDKQTDQPG